VQNVKAYWGCRVCLSCISKTIWSTLCEIQINFISFLRNGSLYKELVLVMKYRPHEYQQLSSEKFLNMVQGKLFPDLCNVIRVASDLYLKWMNMKASAICKGECSTPFHSYLCLTHFITSVWTPYSECETWGFHSSEDIICGFLSYHAM